MEVHVGVAGANLGRMKILKKMKTRFWRPGLTKEVHRYCSSCLTCAKCKSRPKPKAPLHPISSGNPMQRLHIDIVGPLPRSRRGNRYILTVQCSFTIPNQRATTCTRVLVKNWICRYGVPDSIHSDQGRNFESQVFEEMCHLLNINKTRSTAYIIERAMVKLTFSSPETAILLVSTKNRDLWPLPTSEVRDSRTHCLIWQVWLAENYRKTFLRMLKNWDWPEISILVADQKDRGLWVRKCQVENLHKALKSMLKARVDDDPRGWDEQLDYCMMAVRSSVHSFTEHTLSS